MATEELIQYAEDLRNELRYEADVEGAEAMLPEVFARRVLETLVEIGEMDEAVDCYHVDDSVRPAVEVAGYGIEDDETLNLVATIYLGTDPETVSRADVQRAFRRARAFWIRCRDRRYYDELEESSAAWDMAFQLHRTAPTIQRVRTFLLTDGLARVEWVEPETVDGIEYRESVWDLTRLWRTETAGQRGEPIEVDFIARFGVALPALSAPRAAEDFRAFLAVIPGRMLAEIYDEYGSRLLERNVRSFLQFTGKVNKGMRDTIRTEPAHFLAFNNGISATASRVELVALPAGGVGIAAIRDLQIVNGGQTTASVHRAMRTGADVDAIAVQAKITEVNGDLLDELVPRISEYANSQNKVQLADLSSNVPFHIAMESLSRSTWAPATSHTPRQTKWFYERARGQYADSRNREPTRARQRSFQELHPLRQKFTKVDLATYENTWDQCPHDVSKGAQKNFGAYMSRIALRGGDFRPDAAYFQRAIAKAILFRRAERIISAQNFGGYRRNLVTYAIAKLSHSTQQRLDLRAIWATQDIDATLERCIEELAHIAYGVLTTDDRPARNVTEWAKRTECWEQMRRARWELPSALEAQLVPVGRGAAVASANGGDPSDEPPMQPAVPDQLIGVSGDTFLAVSNWAKQTNNLTPWQRRFAYTIGIALKRGKALTPKQTPHAVAILEETRRCGFLPMEPGDEPPESQRGAQGDTASESDCPPGSAIPGGGVP
jgi:hypothetical protein